ncbi:MAG: hypothetical protein E6K34_04745 [Gammaproteobacteria bacterium]|nr:MAG: hypothetical protein E6K34_04745 [Gammaproteobacteria bacterium]TLZ31083.1 MAG: hypothetical protein E6K25_07440 [Gammaproteobacteria bacterium]TLZ47629.1 MAG: hypothetical protein E6K21_12685 [Gammaproteobacteria bacterium]
MRSGSGGASAGRAGAAALVLLAAGCGHLPAMHWPWHQRPAPAAAPVHELDISAAAGAPDSWRQYWRRNTLVVDLTAASGSGSITLKPASGAAWPVRLALRVTPGAIGVLEVRADQRLILPITPAGKPTDLELTPRLYTSATKQMSIIWGPNSAPAP